MPCANLTERGARTVTYPYIKIYAETDILSTLSLAGDPIFEFTCVPSTLVSR